MSVVGPARDIVGLGAWAVRWLGRRRSCRRPPWPSPSATARDTSTARATVSSRCSSWPCSWLPASWSFAGYGSPPPTPMPSAPQSLRFGPWLAVGAYFIPIANLIMPLQSMRDTWKASVEPRDWEIVEVPAILGWWWFFWLAGNIAGVAAFRLSDAEAYPALGEAAATLTIVSDGLTVAACALLAVIVRRYVGAATGPRRVRRLVAQASNRRSQFATARGSSPGRLPGRTFDRPRPATAPWRTASLARRRSRARSSFDLDRRGLDALRRQRNAEPLAERGDRLDQRLALLVGFEQPDEAVVDLDPVERQRLGDGSARHIRCRSRRSRCRSPAPAGSGCWPACTRRSAIRQLSGISSSSRRAGKFVSDRMRSRRCASSGSLNWTADMLTAIFRCAGQFFAASSACSITDSEISPIRPLVSATSRKADGSSMPLRRMLPARERLEALHLARSPARRSAGSTARTRRPRSRGGFRPRAPPACRVRSPSPRRTRRSGSCRRSWPRTSPGRRGAAASAARAIALQAGDADRGADGDDRVLQRGSAATIPRAAVSASRRGRLPRARATVQQHGELVAAQPHAAVLRRAAGADLVGGRHQHRVARLVAVQVVDPLELVEVEQQQRDVLFAAGQQLAGDDVQVAAVVQPGHLVEVREMADPALGGVPLARTIPRAAPSGATRTAAARR